MPYKVCFYFIFDCILHSYEEIENAVQVQKVSSTLLRYLFH